MLPCIWLVWSSSFLWFHLASLSFPFILVSLTGPSFSVCVSFPVLSALHLWTLPASQGRCLYPHGSALHSSLWLPQPWLPAPLIPSALVLFSSHSLSLLLWGQSETCSLPAQAQQQDASAADSSPTPSLSMCLWLVSTTSESCRFTASPCNRIRGSPCNTELPFTRAWATERTLPLTLFAAWKPSLLALFLLYCTKATCFSSKSSYLSVVWSSSLSALWLAQPRQLNFPTKSGYVFLHLHLCIVWVLCLKFSNF